MPVGQAPDQILQQALMGMVPSIKPYEALTELHSRVKNKSMAAAMQGQNAIQQAQQMQQQPPIAAQVAQANQQLNGIAALPVPTTNAYSGGGIVAFSGGGSTPYDEESQEERDREAILSLLRGTGRGAARIGAYGADALTMPLRAAGMGYNQMIRPLRAFGVDIPRIPGALGVESLLPVSGYVSRKFSSGDENTAPQQPPTPAAQTTEETVAVEPPASEPQRVAETPPPPPTGTGTTASRSSTGGAGAPRARMPAWPEYNPQAPQLTLPEAQTAEEMAAEAQRLTAPRLSGYDERMQKFRDRAAAMQRGEGLKTPSRFERGLAGALAGATDEVAAARRAGVRASLGMALAGAGRAAMAGDKEREEKRRELIEKGQQLEMTLEAQRNAYERGEYETANRLGEQARRLAAERNAAINEQAKLDAAARERGDQRRFQEVTAERQEANQAADRAQRAEAARLAAEQRGNASDIAERRMRLAEMVRDPRYGPAIKELEESRKRMIGHQNSPAFAQMRAQYEKNLQEVVQLAAAFGVEPREAIPQLTTQQGVPPIPPDIQNLVNKYTPR
jgi:hypothetical protein